jgi:hypothetical protein
VTPDASSADDSASLDGGGPGEAAPEAACVEGAGTAWRVSVPGQAGVIHAAFDVSITGQPTMPGGIGAISITNDLGTIELGGKTLPAVLYNAPPMNSTDTSFQGIATDADRWVVFWPYCSGTSLVWVDYETSDVPGLVRSAATGSCTASSAATTAPFTWSAQTVDVDTASTAAFRMAGADLTYSGTAPGKASFGGAAWSFWPFAVVDCSACPGGPGDAGWYELHSIVEKDDCATTCFGIYYLYVQTGNPVLLGWLDCLPDLAPPAAGGAVTFQATWSQ